MKSIFSFLVFFTTFSVFAQVKVGENPNTINPSAVLEAESTNKGFLLPRMTTAQREAIQNPAEGLQIYNSTTKCFEAFYGTFWQSIHCGCSAAPSSLSYSDNGPISYCINQAISINSPFSQGGNPSLYAVSPVLPAGLFFNTTTGQITGTPTSLSSSANYTITASNACGSTTRVLNIAVVSVPATPSTISGPSAPTINTSANYSITAVSGATSYTWTVPTGWTINSGQGTTTITVTAGTTAGNVTITATNTCGASAASTKVVSPWRPIVATGGTVTNYTANGSNGVNGIQYRVHSFTAVGNSTFNVTDAGSSGQVDYLVVAGGGGGGNNHGGGGGGGGLKQGAFTLSTGSNQITIGNGGGGGNGNGNAGGNAGNSAAFTFIANGGGGGGGRINTGQTNLGNNGGSGGGGAGTNPTTAGSAFPSGQGNNGGAGSSDATAGNGGGGGGAGAVGEAGTGANGTGKPGNGGIGLPSSITGLTVYYAGGGGGGRWQIGTCSSGGLGGGASGGCADLAVGGTATSNTGGGGGGGGGAVANGGSGGSGIVIIRYPITNPNP